jgi:hypothetical protein
VALLDPRPSLWPSEVPAESPAPETAHADFPKPSMVMVLSLAKRPAQLQPESSR